MYLHFCDMVVDALVICGQYEPNVPCRRAWWVSCRESLADAHVLNRCCKGSEDQICGPSSASTGVRTRAFSEWSCGALLVLRGGLRQGEKWQGSKRKGEKARREER